MSLAHAAQEMHILQDMLRAVAVRQEALSHTLDTAAAAAAHTADDTFLCPRDLDTLAAARLFRSVAAARAGVCDGEQAARAELTEEASASASASSSAADDASSAAADSSLSIGNEAYYQMYEEVDCDCASPRSYYDSEDELVAKWDAVMHPLAPWHAPWKGAKKRAKTPGRKISKMTKAHSAAKKTASKGLRSVLEVKY